MDEYVQDPVAAGQLRIIIESGDGYELSQRMTDAMNELALALEEADSSASEVEGFASFSYEKIQFGAGMSFTYDSLGRGGTIDALWNGKDRFPQKFGDAGY